MIKPLHFAFITALCLSHSAHTGVIIDPVVTVASNENWNAISLGTSPQLGQSFTTASGPGYDQIAVSFQTDGGLLGFTPHASGELFLLSQSYAGSSAGLSSSTPGYIAKSVSALSGAWSFDPAVTLNGGTTYWMYTKNMSATLLRTASGIDPYAGGIQYVEVTQPIGFKSFEARPNNDVVFSVEGYAVPEPTSLALLGLGGLIVSRRRRA